REEMLHHLIALITDGRQVNGALVLRERREGRRRGDGDQEKSNDAAYRNHEQTGAKLEMKRWILPLLVGIAVAIGGLLYARHAASEDVERGLREAENRFVADFERALGEHDHLIDTLSARLRRIDDLKTAQEQVLRRIRNTDHLAAARRYGVERSPTREDLNRLVESGALMRLEDNDFYWIQDLDLSVPYVTPSTAQALEEIGRRFHAALAERGLPPIRFNISSVLRTSESQQELRRINP